MELSRKALRAMVEEELRKIVGEDVIIQNPDPNTPPLSPMDDEEEMMSVDSEESGHDHSMGVDNCPVCGHVAFMINEACGCQHNADINKMDSSLEDKQHAKKSNSYMAKSQLYKVAKYASQLYNMIPDNYELDDWMRSHISGISDDLTEVFHSIDHKLFKGEI